MKAVAGALLLTLIASPSLASIINAASCSQTHVQTAVNSAVNGDTVLVPAGTCTWNSAVSITNKTITLTGAGAEPGGTKVVYGSTGHSYASGSGPTGGLHNGNGLYKYAATPTLPDNVSANGNYFADVVLSVTNSDNLSGILDDVRYYSRALSTQEILIDMDTPC